MAFIDPTELANNVRDYQTTGTMSDKLVAQVDTLITGVLARYDSRHEPDLHGEAWLILLKYRALATVNTEANVFSFLTTCVRNVVRRSWHNQRNERKNLQRYAHVHPERVMIHEPREF